MLKRRAGVTLVEMMVATALFVVVWGAFIGVVISIQTDFRFHAAKSTLLQWNQRIVNDVRSDVISTRGYFENNALGLGYFDALSLDAESLPIDTLRLPTIDENGDFVPDVPGNQKTGNALFFIKTLPPFVQTVAVDAYGNTETYRINVYQFILYHLTLRPDETVGDHQGALDLIRWASIPVADYDQIMTIEDPDPNDSVDPREELAAAFESEYNSTWLWDAGEEVDSAFHQYVAGGGIDSSPTANMSIPRDPEVGLASVIPAGMTTLKQASVCFNTSTPDWGIGVTVPQYAVESSDGDGFPHGFEVQLVGASGSRRLLIRVALAKSASRTFVTRAFSAVLATRDF